MENYIKYEIPSFKIQFEYPEWWDEKIEYDNTYLFWDEFTGSFRITPNKFDSQNFSIDQFLQNKFNEYIESSPTWRIYNKRKYLYFENISKKDNGLTKLHFYISGYENILITCSFAYDKELLEDENSNDEVAGALEEVDNILNSLRIEHP